MLHMSRNFLGNNKTSFYTVCSGKWSETFQSRTKHFFWTREGSIGFIKILASLEFQTLKPIVPSRALSSPEKLLCSRLKSFWSLFATNSIEITIISIFQKNSRPYGLKNKLFEFTEVTDGIIKEAIMYILVPPPPLLVALPIWDDTIIVEKLFTLFKCLKYQLLNT